VEGWWGGEAGMVYENGFSSPDTEKRQLRGRTGSGGFLAPWLV
jgi:hypothetical protein